MNDLISRQALCEYARNQKDMSVTPNEIMRFPSAQQWIPCSESLPDSEAKTYWVCTDTPYQCECRWTNVNPFWTNKTTDWHWNNFDIPQFSKVVAWMSLPEPYKENCDELD